MAHSIPAPGTRDALQDLIEGRLSSHFGRTALVKLATSLMAEERRRAVKFTVFERRQTEALRQELKELHEVESVSTSPPPRKKPNPKYPARLGLGH